MQDAIITLTFDVYGTLVDVDPARMAEHLRTDIGDAAAAFATLWYEKTLEYCFRRGLMQHYATFAACGAEALDYCAQRFQVDISKLRRAERARMCRT